MDYDYDDFPVQRRLRQINEMRAAMNIGNGFGGELMGGARRKGSRKVGAKKRKTVGSKSVRKVPATRAKSRSSVVKKKPKRHGNTYIDFVRGYYMKHKKSGITWKEAMVEASPCYKKFKKFEC